MSYLRKAKEALADLRHDVPESRDLDAKLPQPSPDPEPQKKGYLRRAKDTLADLRREAPAASEAHEQPLPIQEHDVLEMRLDSFAKAGLIVTVWSDVLNREVLFVSDNAPDEAIEGRNLVVYRAADLANLAQARPTPGALRFIHEIKAVFGGTIRTTTADQEEAP